MKELFYIAPDGTMMRVPLSVTSVIEPGSPQIMFRTRVSLTYDDRYRSHSAGLKDGQRFLVVVPVPGLAPSSMTVIVNWTASVAAGAGRR